MKLLMNGDIDSIDIKTLLIERPRAFESPEERLLQEKKKDPKAKKDARAIQLLEDEKEAAIQKEKQAIE